MTNVTDDRPRGADQFQALVVVDEENKVVAGMAETLFVPKDLVVGWSERR